MKKDNLLLSFIVPVYNVEKYLERCILSLLKQGLDEDTYEIILVNDGSTDGSFAICQRYCDLYEIIRVISQDNQGLSATRNTGIREAHGEYLCFVDSDDYLDDNGLSAIINHCKEGVDAVRFWCRIIHPHTTDDVAEANGRVTFRGNGHSYLKEYGLETFCVNWLYKRTYLLDNNLSFKAVIGEDFLFMADFLLSNPMVVSVAARIYNYEIHEESISSTRSVENSRRWVDDLLDTLSYIVKRLNEYKEHDSALYEACMNSIEGKMTPLFSRILSADYTLAEYKKKVERCKVLGVMPLKATGSMMQRLARTATNMLFKHPITYLFTKGIYNKVFIPFIKPKIDRNG